MDAVKISAVIITLNEEKNIQQCIDSVRDVADEIVVVDSFSTDRTEEICRKNGVRFLQHAWPGYGGQKNWGNGQASFDYILSIDADERLSDELGKAIRAIKENWQYDVYSFNRLTFFHGKPMRYSIYPDRQLRLFDRRKTQWKENKVHERLITGEGITLKRINKDMLHFANESIHELVKTLNDYSSLSAEGGFRPGRKQRVFKLVFSPAFAFFKTYVLKLGFLDGAFGFVICVNKAHYRFLKYAKGIELCKTDKMRRGQEADRT